MSARGAFPEPDLPVAQARRGGLGSAEAIFGPRPSKNGPDPQARKLSAENARMKDVIVEITAENLDLKKTLSD